MRSDVHTPRFAPVALLLLAQGALAQTGGVPADSAVRVEPPIRFNASLNLTSAYTFAHELDAGGDLQSFDAGLNLVFLATLDERRRLVFSYNTTYTHYDFSDGAGAFSDPWDDVLGLSLGVRSIHRITPHVDLIAGLSGRSDRELGADFADSVAFNGFVGSRYVFSDALSLGLGVGIITQLEDDPTIFPIPLVEWKFADGWTLSTVSSPIGASLEFLARDQSYSVALSAGYESRNFRLDAMGVAPDGAVTDRRALIALEGTLNFSHQFSLAGTVGVNAWQELKIEDDNGGDVATTNADPSAFVQLTATFRF